MQQFCCRGLFHWLGLEPGIGLFRRPLRRMHPTAGSSLLEAGCLWSSEWSWVGYVPPAPRSTGEALLMVLVEHHELLWLGKAEAWASRPAEQPSGALP